MCLTLKTTRTKYKIAKEDIVCYKILNYCRSASFYNIKSGDEFSAYINNCKVNGTIAVYFDTVYFKYNFDIKNSYS